MSGCVRTSNNVGVIILLSSSSVSIIRSGYFIGLFDASSLIVRLVVGGIVVSVFK